MFRKIVKQGNSAYTLTLPSNWVKSNNLDFGDYVELTESNQNILISTSKSGQVEVVELDLRGVSRPEMFQVLINSYISGFDKISVKHSDLKTIMDVSNEFTGMILEESSDKFAIFSSVVLKDNLEVDTLIRKTGFFLKELSSKLVLVSAGKFSLSELKRLEKVMDKNILYILRFLNKYENISNSYTKFLYAYVFDMIGDSISEIAAHIGSDVKLAKLVNKNVNLYVDYIFAEKSTNLVMDLRKFRNSIEKKTFVDGLVYGLAEVMYNFVGVLIRGNQTNNNK
jgi:antitoxin component of MazEF toxin-antitoxin module